MTQPACCACQSTISEPCTNCRDIITRLELQLASSRDLLWDAIDAMRSIKSSRNDFNHQEAATKMLSIADAALNKIQTAAHR